MKTNATPSVKRMRFTNLREAEIDDVSLGSRRALTNCASATALSVIETAILPDERGARGESCEEPNGLSELHGTKELLGQTAKACLCEAKTGAENRERGHNGPGEEFGVMFEFLELMCSFSPADRSRRKCS